MFLNFRLLISNLAFLTLAASFLGDVFLNVDYSLSELDALGDELLADEDSSYLDEAASAPAIPEGVPTDTKNKVEASSVYIFCEIVKVLCLITSLGI